MRHIEFELSKKDYGAFAGKYKIRELTAQQGIDAITALVELKKIKEENPNAITIREVKLALIHAAATKDGTPIILDFDKIPHRVWALLLEANEKLNVVSDEDAAFLLKPSS